jgi:hypothetical protein
MFSELSFGGSSNRVEEIPAPEGIGQASEAVIWLSLQLKDSGVVVDALGKTSAGLMVCIVEKSVPGVRSTILGTGSKSIGLPRYSLSGGTRIIDAVSSGRSAS